MTDWPTCPYGLNDLSYARARAFKAAIDALIGHGMYHGVHSRGIHADSFLLCSVSVFDYGVSLDVVTSVRTAHHNAEQGRIRLRTVSECVALILDMTDDLHCPVTLSGS